MIAKEITAYNNAQTAANKAICRALAIVGYWVRKHGVQLMFWSGQSFDEPGLTSNSEKFKSAVARYESKDDINVKDLKRWLRKSKTIQWDYKNIVKRKGRLERLKASDW